ncbi:hypothetical protein LR48_Vigan09g055200 [Vigna angularis]|uniref:Uncharacterized protein n=1 Tax=Phaseolus angularis TaxID=3914 RepID=A0A0L9VA52_PHAAN|nr:hypothetical protein LR48_Vigan09g055200 [Vigna angularis]
MEGLQDENNMSIHKKIRKRRAEELGLESPDLAPPAARHKLWKAAQTKSNGQFTSQSAQEISQRIDDLVDQKSQGTFVAQGREDLLVAATGRLDRLGRVRAVGGAIGLKDYFGPKPRSTEAVTQEIISSIRKLVQVELEESMRIKMNWMKEVEVARSWNLEKTETVSDRTIGFGRIQTEWAERCEQERKLPNGQQCKTDRSKVKPNGLASFECRSYISTPFWGTERQRHGLGPVLCYFYVLFKDLHVLGIVSFDGLSTETHF